MINYLFWFSKSELVLSAETETRNSKRYWQQPVVSQAACLRDPSILATRPSAPLTPAISYSLQQAESNQQAVNCKGRPGSSFFNANHLGEELGIPLWWVPVVKKAPRNLLAVNSIDIGRDRNTGVPNIGISCYMFCNFVKPAFAKVKYRHFRY